MDSFNLNIKVGCDIVNIKRFKSLGKKILLKMFHESELKSTKPETIAGLFAAKESCRKVFNELGWHDVEIKKMRSGRPVLSIDLNKIDKKVVIISSDLSISHDGDYAAATAVFLVKT